MVAFGLLIVVYTNSMPVRSTYDDTRYFAIKAINKARVVRRKQAHYIVREAGILSSLQKTGQCPFVVTFWGAFHDSQHVYMVMEFVQGGDLSSLLRKFKVLTLDQNYDKSLIDP